MSKKHYAPEFKREAASLVLDQDYSIAEACEAMGVGRTAIHLRTRIVGILPLKSGNQTAINFRRY